MYIAYLTRIRLYSGATLTDNIIVIEAVTSFTFYISFLDSPTSSRLTSAPFTRVQKKTIQRFPFAIDFDVCLWKLPPDSGYSGSSPHSMFPRLQDIDLYGHSFLSIGVAHGPGYRYAPFLIKTDSEIDRPNFFLFGMHICQRIHLFQLFRLA